MGSAPGRSGSEPSGGAEVDVSFTRVSAATRASRAKNDGAVPARRELSVFEAWPLVEYSCVGRDH